MDVLTRNRMLARGHRPAGQAQLDHAASADSLRNADAVMLIIVANREQADQETQEATQEAAGQIPPFVAEKDGRPPETVSSYTRPQDVSEVRVPAVQQSYVRPHLVSEFRPPAHLSYAGKRPSGDPMWAHHECPYHGHTCPFGCPFHPQTSLPAGDLPSPDDTTPTPTWVWVAGTVAAAAAVGGVVYAMSRPKKSRRSAHSK